MIKQTKKFEEHEMIRKIFLYSILLISLTAVFTFSQETVECFYVVEQGGDWGCAIACTDGTVYPVDCNSDIIQDMLD